jgi:hypothetical protein
MISRVLVFTMVTDSPSEMARPFRTVCTVLPAVEKVIPADEMIVPTMIPPPAPLIEAALPIYQKTFLACGPFFQGNRNKEE